MLSIKKMCIRENVEECVLFDMINS
jgi:hypothetical protein